MPLTEDGRDFVAEAVMNDSTPTFFDNTNAAIGVGSTGTAYDKTQTTLVAELDRAGMMASYPQRTTNTITFKSEFATGDANGAWAEWGIFNNITAGGVMLSRKDESLGTKTSAQTWQVTVSLSVLVGV